MIIQCLFDTYYSLETQSLILKNVTASSCITSFLSTWTQGLVSTQVSYPPRILLCGFINGKNIARILFYTKVRKFKVIVAIPTTTCP